MKDQESAEGDTGSARDRREELLPLLRRGSWFGGLREVLQAAILDRCQEKSYQRGKLIVQQEDPPRALFGVLTGQVSVTRWIDADREVLIHIGDSGFWFGELGLMAGIPAVGNVYAHTDARLAVLPIHEFERIVDEEPRYYRDFALLALERYAIFLRLTADIQALAPEERLRSRLADIVELRRIEAGEPDTLEISATQSELAAMIGVSRQTVNELLHQLEAKGLIEVQFKKILVTDPSRLRRPATRQTA